MNRIKLLMVCAIVANSIMLQAQTLVFQAKTFETQKWGYANLEGEIIIPAEYEKCYPFSSNGLAVIYDGKERQYHFIDLKNTRLKTDPESFKTKDVFGFNLGGFSDHLFLVEVKGKWGYMNDEGKLAIPAIYDEGSNFNGGHANVKKGKTIVLIDTKGNETTIAAPAVDVKEFSEGLAAIETKGKFGFINTKGELVIPADFHSVGYFKNGLAWAKSSDEKLGYIDKDGKWVIKPEFEAGKEFDPVSGLARVKKEGKWCYISESGEILNIDAESYGDFSEGLADGKKGASVGFFDKEGKWVIEPQFQAVRDFHNGYAAARLHGKWGIIDKTGKWTVEPKFDAVKDVTLIK